MNVIGWVRILLNESSDEWFFFFLFGNIRQSSQGISDFCLCWFWCFVTIVNQKRVGGDAVGSYRILSIVMRPDWPIRGRHCQFYWWPLGSREHSRIISFCVFSIFDDKTKTIFRESRLRRKKKKKYGNWRGRVKIKQVNLQRQKKNIKMEIVEPMSPESVNRLCKESLQKKNVRRKYENVIRFWDHNERKDTYI